MLFKREPVLWLGLVSAGIQLGLGFGINITAQQVTLIMLFVTAVISFIIRQNVYAPIDKNGNPIVGEQK